MPFYVYVLIDPRDGRVFYVGKGQGDRLSQHQRDVLRRGPERAGTKKERLILDVLNSGARVIETIVRHFDDETQALACEADLIAQYGIENLTNIKQRGELSVNPINVAESSANRIRVECSAWLAAAPVGRPELMEFMQDGLAMADLLLAEVARSRAQSCHVS